MNEVSANIEADTDAPVTPTSTTENINWTYDISTGTGKLTWERMHGRCMVVTLEVVLFHLIMERICPSKTPAQCGIKGYCQSGSGYAHI